SPVGTIEAIAISQRFDRWRRPLSAITLSTNIQSPRWGFGSVVASRDPALKRWAIVVRPSGTHLANGRHPNSAHHSFHAGPAMSHSYTSSLYHCVFSTKERRRT